MQFSAKAWIVIADGAQANVVEYHGKHAHLTLVENGRFEQPNLASRDIASDNQGQTSVGRGSNVAHGAMESSSDPHEYEEFRFVGEVSQFLNDQVNRYDKIVLVAAPKALGTLRKQISRNVEAKVCLEINKDLTNMPLDDVQALIGEKVDFSVGPAR